MSNELKTPLPLKPTSETVPPSGTVFVSPQDYIARRTAVGPLRKAFSIERGLHGWCFVTITYTDDGKTVAIERTEPDLKAIVLEKFKIAAHKYWSTIG